MSVLGMNSKVRVRGTAEQVSIKESTADGPASGLSGSKQEETQQSYVLKAAYAAGGRTAMGVGSVLGVPLVARSKALQCLGRTRRRGLGEGTENASQLGNDLWSSV